MLRKHFAMSGDNKPDFIITYHAPKRVPFFGGYAKNWVYGYPNYGTGFVTDENPIKFKVIGDKWEDGVGEWKFRLEDSSNRIYNSMILGKKIDNLNLNKIVFAGMGHADAYVKGAYDENGNIIPQTTVDNINIITSVIFGEGIETINGSILNNTGDGQSTCTEITLPESVTQLTGHLFDYYNSLKTITVPQNVIRIDNLCNIDGEDSLEEVILKPLTPPDASNASSQVPLGYNSNNVKDSLKIRVYADAIDNYKNDSIWSQYSDLYDTINDTIVYYIDGSRKMYIENQDITIVNSGILSQSITNVYLPNSVTEIDEWAFNYCSNLTSITIPDSVTIIGSNAFQYCSGLTSVVIGNSVSSIGSSAFSGCSQLTSVIIPDSVTSIGYQAFYQCSGLTSVVIGNQVTSIGKYAFNGTHSSLQIYVPDESVDAYKAATNWSSYADKIKPISEKPA